MKGSLIQLCDESNDGRMLRQVNCLKVVLKIQEMWYNTSCCIMAYPKD